MFCTREKIGNRHPMPRARQGRRAEASESGIAIRPQIAPLRCAKGVPKSVQLAGAGPASNPKLARPNPASDLNEQGTTELTSQPVDLKSRSSPFIAWQELLEVALQTLSRELKEGTIRWKRRPLSLPRVLSVREGRRLGFV